jgi:hypothetical protein
MVLSQDVQNPRPDKRHRYDWTKWELWRMGETFEIEKLGDVELIRHTRRGRPDSRFVSAYRHPEQFAALRPYLVAAPAPRRKAPTITIEEAEKLVQEAWVGFADGDELEAPVINLALRRFRDEILFRLRTLRFPCCGGSDENPPNHTQDCSRNE